MKITFWFKLKKQHNEDKNKEAELEKKEENKKYEKQVGLLKYLVDEELDMKSWNFFFKVSFLISWSKLDNF